MNKKKRIGLLSGGKKSYLSTITKFLEFLKEKNQSDKQIQEWIKQEFPSLKSSRMVNDLSKTLLSLKLTISEGGNLKLTIAGNDFLSTHDPKIIFEMLCNRYEGINEVLEILQEKPNTLDEITFALKEKLHAKWKTNAQCIVRLSWLESLGYLEKNGQYFVSTESPNNFSNNELEERSLSHEQIQDEIFEIGKRCKFVSQKEYSLGKCFIDNVWQRIEEGCPAFVFEIHLNGILSDALAELKYAWLKFGNPNLYLVTNAEEINNAKNALRTSFPEIFAATRILDWKEIHSFYESLNGINRKGEKIGFPVLKFRKMVNKSNQKQKLSDLGFEPLAPYIDFEMTRIFDDADKIIVSGIINFVKKNENVSQVTILKTFCVDQSKLLLLLEFLWKEGYFKKTKSKTDGEWLFSLR